MKIVIPDDYQDCVRHLDAFARLEGHDVTVYHDTVADEDALVERFRDAEALVLIRERTPITASLLARLPKLKAISQTGGGAAHVDLAACKRHGVTVMAGTGSPHATAELTWGLVLAAMRHIPEEFANLKAGRWQRTLGTDLKGRTLGIFGYGKIGRLIARYGQAFEMNVLVWGREGTRARATEAGLDVAASQAELFERSDVLSLHLRLNADTRGIVTAADLARMKPDALLVNTSRAPLIEPGALEAALRKGRPGRAAVDVFEQEPVTNHPLLALPNVLATPHLGYVEQDSYERYFGDAFDNLLAFEAGRPVNNLAE
ncbi:D-2-hydroxyacid dehydrogenase family protein [Halomonas sp. MCCC 1A17488]|uniref:D-2-hydroxyacid dehydrogenase family protein n=1 Tax=unclassified Halomonas TaxID=2609666 RepID=UPI0018D218E9|nr:MULTISPECIES: D-2-hydroxyacid dehydrogenase family protein [unclassified Halomonas]MCE8017688.1 D-2-hydroxyacid dehydrogenase family protein [Halomonas sp. MCCC 1A17488]MCG3241021.1 D-2-hydroxyacid dehydrogenase family protein [Halomonas sp. MCCC 1A17488]QPP48887.1 D-2-hydroxyacid dehydrogenase family protein [Halomonas sp. SS10-MC5]